jgi:hypothetical protein
MNFNRSRSWPHPVLSPSTDDIADSSAFDFNLDVVADYKRWLLEVDIPSLDEHISQLVAANCAAFVLHVDCKRTYYRSTARSLKNKFEVMIGGEHLFGTVEVSLVVLATKDLDQYGHPKQHPDYGTATFDVSVGQPLAVAQTKVFDAYLESDPILKLSSILDIRRGEPTQKGMQVECDADRIIAILPSDEYDSYREVRTDAAIRGLLATTVIFPAVMDALFYLAERGQDLDDFKADHRWARCVLSRLERHDIDLSATGSKHTICLEAVQTLLREPIRRGLDDIRSLLS